MHYFSKVLILILMLTYSFTSAQENSDTIIFVRKVNYRLGITPSAIINIVPAIQLSHELSFSNPLSLGLETGYIFAHGTEGNNNVSGLRLRPSLNVMVSNYLNRTVKLQLFYNYRYFTAERVADVTRANGAYTEKVKGTGTNYLKGWGLGVEFGFFNGPIGMNFGFGVGSGEITNEYSRPEIIPGRTLFFNTSSQGKLPFPILFIHANIILFKT